MKHARKDYDRIQDPAGLIPENEPVFLLRAKDQFAPQVIRKWANLVEQSNGQPEIILSARMQADKMENWQKFNKAKMPDMPTEDNFDNNPLNVLLPENVFYKLHEFVSTEKAAYDLCRFIAEHAKNIVAYQEQENKENNINGCSMVSEKVIEPLFVKGDVVTLKCDRFKMLVDHVDSKGIVHCFFRMVNHSNPFTPKTDDTLQYMEIDPVFLQKYVAEPMD